MIGQVIGFLGSSAGAAVVGLLLEWWGHRARAKEQAKQAEHQRDLAYHNQLEKHNELLDKAQEAKTHDRKFRFKLWFFEFERNYQVVMYPPRTWVVAISLLMLVTTFCSILVLWAGWPQVPVDTLDPNEESNKVGVPWLFMAEFYRNDIFTLSLGGNVYSMIVSVNFIITTAIVGSFRRILR